MVKTLHHSSYFAGWPNTANTTEYWFSGGSGLSGQPRTTESETQVLHRNAGTFSNLSVRLTANSVNTSTTFTFRKNAADGNMTFSVASGATGNFEDTSHTDRIASGDKTSLKTVPGTTGTFTMTANAFTFDADTDTVTRLVLWDFQTIVAASTTVFNNLGGLTPSSATNTTEANVKCRQRKAGSFKNICLNIIQNLRTTATTYVSRKNGVDGTITMSIAAGTTGFVEEGTPHTDSVAVDDDYNHKLTWGTGAEALTITTWQIDFISTGGCGQMVIASRAGDAVAEPVTTFLPLGGFFITGTEQSFLISTPYIFSDLTCLISLNGITTASTLTLRKNAVSTALVCSITASTTGVFSDTTHTVTAAANDAMGIQIATPSVGGTPTITFRNVSLWTFLNSSAQSIFVEWEES